ncbi:MAG TPA: ABC transporter permease [Steroidobacteraceae bacterium]|nr:ABC transporter permease [Steroidobacteraceae bacterium]
MYLVKQFAGVTVMNLKSVAHRPGPSSVIVIGIMGVVVVLISILALGTSLAESIRSTGQPDRAIVLRAGTEEEAGSSLFIDDVHTIMDTAGIATSAAGEPIATADMVTVVNLPKKENATEAGVVVRGMTEHGRAVRDEIRLVEGRWFEPGLSELVVGRSAQTEFSGLKVGDKVRLRRGAWTVVGVFESGNALQGSLLADAKTLMSAYQRARYSSVTVRLKSPAAFKEFKDSLTTNPTLSVNPVRESDYYRQLSADVSGAAFLVSFVLGGVMAIGAFFGALNTMYTTVSNRRVEIATLRAMGFSGGCVAASILAEAMLLAAAGGLVGTAISWLLLSGNTFGLGSKEGSVVAQLHVTPELLAIGLVWACAVGFLGGLLPAIRAARMPVATALKAE